MKRKLQCKHTQPERREGLVGYIRCKRSAVFHGLCSQHYPESAKARRKKETPSAVLAFRATEGLADETPWPRIRMWAPKLPVGPCPDPEPCVDHPRIWPAYFVPSRSGFNSAEELARLFHETYERLAPSLGYVTREESAKPWTDVPNNNKRLMIAVAAEILLRYEMRREG